MKIFALASTFSLISLLTFGQFQPSAAQVEKAQHDSYISHHQLRTPVKFKPLAGSGSSGLSPAQVKKAYNLPDTGGSGTIALVTAYDAPTAEADINTFSARFGLASCTTSNGCFEKHKMSLLLPTNSGWAVEASLDTQWAHAIAPRAKILLVEARSDYASDLLAAVDYARNRPDVTAISMSWGGNEFSFETLYDYHFRSNFGASFFAASGDDGHGVSWPSVASGVISVGGSSLHLNSNGTVSSETAWSGSGGGRSAYESEPGYQATYNVAAANGRRATPDVAYNADPASGYAVYDSTPYGGFSGWWSVGGTSAGTPQWAAIKALGSNVNAAKIYSDATSNSYAGLRDITSGTNGTCALYCTAGSRFDYVTGLGSPLTTSF